VFVGELNRRVWSLLWLLHRVGGESSGAKYPVSLVRFVLREVDLMAYLDALLALHRAPEFVARASLAGAAGVAARKDPD
jgi:hypothetical protein